jgi:signal peptidase I
MTKIYTTYSFFRDLSPSMDSVADLVGKVIDKTKILIRKLVNSDIEALLIETLVKLPVFVFILFLGFIITFALINMSEPEKGYRMATILSSSMYPTVKPGSVVFIGPPDNIHIGDIISFHEKSVLTGDLTGRTLAHRIVDRSGLSQNEAFVTKGDANDSSDPGYIYTKDIIGKVLFVIPYLGYVSYVSLTSWGLFFFIFIPCVVLVFSEIKHLKRVSVKGK